MGRKYVGLSLKAPVRKSVLNVMKNIRNFAYSFFGIFGRVTLNSVCMQFIDCDVSNAEVQWIDRTTVMTFDRSRLTPFLSFNGERKIPKIKKISEGSFLYVCLFICLSVSS